MLNKIKGYSFILIILLGGAAYFFTPLIIDDGIVLWAFAHLVLNAAVFHYHTNVFKNKAEEVFPLIPAMAIFNVINFTIALFYVASDEYQLTPVSTDALMHSFIALIIFYVVYYSLYNVFSTVKRFHNFNIYNKSVNLVIYLSTAIYFIGFYNDLGFPILIQASMYFVVGAILFKIISKSKVHFIEYVIFGYTVYREITDRATSGLIYLILVFFLYCFFVLQLSTNKRIKTSISIFIIVFSVLYYVIFSPIKNAYRQFAWLGDNKVEKITTIDRINKIIELSSEAEANKNY